MSNFEESKQSRGIKVRNSAPVHLKDSPKRQFVPIHLKNLFGFVPDIIIIEKVRGQNNRIVVRAVLTEEELKKEEETVITTEEKKED
jgi:hypothetical protein